jgi:hypothetical protein
VKPEIRQLVEQEVAKLLHDATTDPIRTKLRNLHQVCQELVVGARQRLTVPSVVRRYRAKFADPEVSIAESSIRNKRSGANPYKKLYDTWEAAAEAILTSYKSNIRKELGGGIVTEDEITRIEDDTVRHMVRLLWAQNRSLSSQLDILRRVRGAPVVQIMSTRTDTNAVSLGQPVANDLALNEAEIEALRNFVNERFLKARNIRRATNGSLQLSDGRSLADPGFVEAIEKIILSYVKC